MGEDLDKTINADHMINAGTAPEVSPELAKAAANLRGKGLKDVTLSLYGAQNRIANWMQANVKDPDAKFDETAATFSAINDSILEAINYFEYIQLVTKDVMGRIGK